MDREPSTQPISKLEFEFERRKLAKDDVRELIYREVGLPAYYMVYWSGELFLILDTSVSSKQILEYHPQMLQEYLRGGEQTSGFMYPRLGQLCLLESIKFFPFDSIDNALHIYNQ